MSQLFQQPITGRTKHNEKKTAVKSRQVSVKSVSSPIVYNLFIKTYHRMFDRQVKHHDVHWSADLYLHNVKEQSKTVHLTVLVCSFTSSAHRTTDQVNLLRKLQVLSVGNSMVSIPNIWRLNISCHTACTI